MWSTVIINVLILAVGLLTGIMIGDRASENQQIDELRKEIRRLENVLPQQK